MLGILKRSQLRTALLPRCQACGHAVDAEGQSEVNPIRGQLILSAPMSVDKLVLITGCKVCCGERRV